MKIRLPVLVSLLGCGLVLIGRSPDSARAEAAREAGAKRPAGPLDHVLFFNGTMDEIQYQAWYKGAADRIYTPQLNPGGYHLWRNGRGLICRYGTPATKAALGEGAVYEFRAGTHGGALSLVRIPLQTGESLADNSKGAAVKARLSSSKFAVPETRVAGVERSEPPEIRPTGGSLRSTPGTPRSNLEVLRLSSRGQTVDLGTIDLMDGSAEARVVVPLKHDAGSRLAVRFAMDLGLARGRVRVDPEVAEVTSDEQVPLRLLFENIPSGGEVSGKLLVTEARDTLVRPLTIPVSGQLRSRLTRLSTDGETLSVVTWPPGAPVYLTDLCGRYPWAQEYLGMTPVEYRLPAGMYQVVLVQPEEASGRWAAPAGQASTVGFGPKSASCLSVDCTKQKGMPVLVRALWLPLDGPIVERLVKATEGAADLFALPPLGDFQHVCYEMFGRARIELSDDDVERMYGVLRKSGYLRYEADGREAIDVDFDPGGPEPFRFRAVTLSR